MAAIPPVPAATALAPENLRSRRRSMRAMTSLPRSPMDFILYRVLSIQRGSDTSRLRSFIARSLPSNRAADRSRKVNYDEAAAILALPVGTINSRLARARQTLRKIFNFEMGFPSPGSGHHRGSDGTRFCWHRPHRSRQNQCAMDSSLEGNGFEPLVPQH